MANVWDVYTVGDVSFVHEVFLGISHIFYGRGENVFLQVYMIGMLLGFIWIFIESMIQQKPIAIGRFFVAFILYSALFVPQATVHLEDSQTKKFYTMDHIPLGLAAGASIVSKIGMGLTRTFEDFFTPIGGAGSGCSPTQMTCTGYLGSLNKIIQIRNNLSSKPAFLAIDRALCNASTDAPALPSDEQLVCNIEKTISNYVRDCSINKFLAKPQLLGTMRGLEDLRYGNASYSTDVYLQPTGKQTLNCHVAFQQIQARLTEKQSEIEKLSLKSEWITMTAHNHTGGGDDTDRMITGAGVNHNQITEILALMTGTSGTTPDAYAYIKNVMFRGPIEEGLIQGFTSAGDLRAAMMIKSAKDQRNIQWAAEENMWISTAKAMATFFEGFVVALAALIPFVMFMGGLNIMVEYLKVLMWVQLWNPVMAICNLYIQTVASQKVKDAIANSPITDLYVIDSVEEVAQHWIAVGGLMAATTPLLALFILKGSVYTFTTLASRMSGGDHVNEKIASPDVMQHAPMMLNNAGAWTADEAKGPRGYGKDPFFRTLSVDKVRSNMVSSADQSVKQASEKYSNSLGRMLQTVEEGGISESFANNVMKNLQTNHNEQYQKLYNDSKEFAQQNGMSEDQSTIHQLAVALALQAQGSFGLGKALSGALGFALSRTTTDTESESFKTNWQNTVSKIKSRMGSYSDGNSLASSLADSEQAAVNSTYGNKGSDSSVHNTQQAYDELKSKQKTYSVQRQRSDSMGSKQSMDSGMMSRTYISDKDHNDFMKSLGGSAWLLKQELEKGGYMTGKSGREIDVEKAALLEWAYDKGLTSDTAAYWEKFGSSLPISGADPSGDYSWLQNQKIAKHFGGEQKTDRDAQGLIKLGKENSQNGRNALNQEKVDNYEAWKKLREEGRAPFVEWDERVAKEERERRENVAKTVGKNTEKPGAYSKFGEAKVSDRKAADFNKFMDTNFLKNNSINKALVRYGMAYLNNNRAAWVDGHGNVGWQKFDKFADDNPELREKAIYEVQRNNGLSYEEAEAIVVNSPRLMLGVLRDYNGMSNFFTDPDNYEKNKSLDKRVGGLQVSGDQELDENYYKSFSNHGEDNKAYRHLKELTTDHGNDFNLGVVQTNPNFDANKLD